MYLMDHVGGVTGIRNDDIFGGTIELRRCVRVWFVAGATGFWYVSASDILLFSAIFRNVAFDLHNEPLGSDTEQSIVRRPTFPANRRVHFFWMYFWIFERFKGISQWCDIEYVHVRQLLYMFGTWSRWKDVEFGMKKVYHIFVPFAYGTNSSKVHHTPFVGY
jgi:hypothetical protein